MSNYADIIKKGNNSEKSTSADTPDDAGLDKYDGNFRKSNTSLRKPNPSLTRRNCNYDSWEHAYFQDLLNMRDIFAEKVLNILPDAFHHVYSPQFLYKFAKMIYNNSTGEISPYLEKIPEHLESTYLEYLIKRKDSYYK